MSSVGLLNGNCGDLLDDKQDRKSTRSATNYVGKEDLSDSPQR